MNSNMNHRRWFTARSVLRGWMAHCLVCLLSPSPDLQATPLIALREANNCGGCHNPGRSQRPVLERRCTLDCQGCHIDPSGAGPRNEWGYYYSQSNLASVNFFKPIDPLQDRSRFSAHYDGRIIQRRVEHGSSQTFPMSSEVGLRVKPFMTHLHATYQGTFLGRVGDSLRATLDDDRRYREKYALMVDALPMNTYVRAYQGPPMYGLRRPNHSLWIRERLGLDQFAATRAIEAGGTPNVPFMRGSYMLGDPYSEPEDRQKGTSFHGGFRGVTLGWHLNGSAWDTTSEKAAVQMRALAAGANIFKVLIYAERNWRSVTEVEDPPGSADFASPAVKVYPSSEISEYTIAFAQIPGVTLGGVHETLLDETQDSYRRSAFIDLHPVPYLQFEIWRRFQRGTRSLADTLGVVHVYADF